MLIDLWTDPQIHTADGGGYGYGDMEMKIRALKEWLCPSTHIYATQSGHSLKLSKFDLTETEKEDMKKFDMSNAMTCVQESEEVLICDSPKEQSNLHSFLSRSQSRTLSTASSIMSDVSESCEEEFYSQSLPGDSFLMGQGRTGQALI